MTLILLPGILKYLKCALSTVNIINMRHVYLVQCAYWNMRVLSLVIVYTVINAQHAVINLRRLQWAYLKWNICGMLQFVKIILDKTHVRYCVVVQNERSIFYIQSFITELKLQFFVKLQFYSSFKNPYAFILNYENFMLDFIEGSKILK